MNMASKYPAYGDVLRKVECLDGVRKATVDNDSKAWSEGKDVEHDDYKQLFVDTLSTYWCSRFSYLI